MISLGAAVIKDALVPTFGQSTLVGIIENKLLKDPSIRAGVAIQDKGAFVANITRVLTRIRNEIMEGQSLIKVSSEERLEDIKFISYNISNTEVSIVYFIKTAANIFPNVTKA